MKRNGFAVSLALALVVAFAIGSAEARHKQRRFTSKMSGSSISAQFDSNGDGQNGITYHGEGKSNLGMRSEQGIIEMAFSPDSCTVKGNPGVKFGSAATLTTSRKIPHGCRRRLALPHPLA